jgi:hypothetical protein
MTEHHLPSSPPKWTDKLLEWFCPDEWLEEVQGDLQERYHLRVEKLGEKNARRLYIKEVFAYLQPFLLRPNHTLKPIYPDMFKHNLLLIYRNFKRFKSTFFINLIGLSTGLLVPC